LNRELLVQVKSLSKAWAPASSPRERASALLRLLVGVKLERKTTLSDVSLDVFRGESLGIIGSNGAGKSTLLKLITGLLHPTTGSVVVKGKIGALIELGAGFEQERTGRENLYISAALHGIDAHALTELVPEIVAFADIGEYIDQPVKHYSSGMVVRLGFALISALRPDLLITDEVLAVGDESFQRKCIRWIEEYLADGGTLLLVSHSTYHIQKLCKHALWLKDGKVHAYGDVFSVTQDYLAFHERLGRAMSEPAERVVSQNEYRVDSVRINGSSDEKSLLSEPMTQCDVFVVSPDGRPPRLGWGILRADGTAIYGAVSDMHDAKPFEYDEGFKFVIHIDLSSLLPGQYTLRFHAMDPEGLRMYDTVERFITLRGETRELGLVRIPHSWSSGVTNV